MLFLLFMDLFFQWEASTNGFTLICPSVCQFAAFPETIHWIFQIFCRMLEVNNPTKLMELYLLGKFPSFVQNGKKIVQKKGLSYFLKTSSWV